MNTALTIRQLPKSSTATALILPNHPGTPYGAPQAKLVSSQIETPTTTLRRAANTRLHIPCPRS